MISIDIKAWIILLERHTAQLAESESFESTRIISDFFEHREGNPGNRLYTLRT